MSLQWPSQADTAGIGAAEIYCWNLNVLTVGMLRKMVP